MVYINVSYVWFINLLYNPCRNLTHRKEGDRMTDVEIVPPRDGITRTDLKAIVVNSTKKPIAVKVDLTPSGYLRITILGTLTDSAY